MHTISLEVPLAISEAEVKVLLAMKLYETGKLSLGQAARLAGFSKRAFMDVLGQHKIPVFNYPAEDLEREIAL